jgi:hypothetical protein
VGTFKIEITAVGGHGCQREVKDGGTVYGCGYRSCPDCTARAVVEELKRQGCSVTDATLTHWPGELGEVQDDLLTKIRIGSFK